jgi:aspartyl/asparaginyl-tRNA synthetase
MDENNDMEDEIQAQMFEEASGFIAINYPPALRKFYDKCVQEGFTQDQSMSLVARYFEMLMSHASHTGHREDDHEI